MTWLLVVWVALGAGFSYEAARGARRTALMEMLGGALVVTGLLAIGVMLHAAFEPDEPLAPLRGCEAPAGVARPCAACDAARNDQPGNAMTDRPLDRRLLLQAAALSPALAAAAASQAGAAAADGKLVVVAELVSRPDRADALRDIMVPFVAGARKEPGCEHYTLLEDVSQPGRFLTYEVWTDDAALAAHMTTPAIKEATPKLADILAQPFTQAKLKVLSAS